MSAAVLPPPLPPPLPESPEQRLIDEQLDRTRAQVKAVDAAFGLLAAAVGMLSLLLAAIVVDHWVFGLGKAGRVAALAAVLGWGTYCLWRWVAPTLMRRINPLFAAYAIERQEPSLKNSLINYLFVRGQPDAAAVVRDALERQAAHDLAAVPVETAVDRTPVLRLGYALVAVVLACGAYKILSPKDPFRTVARVLAPLADIARPSRVTIRNVAPGHGEAFHGQTVRVSAEIEGLRPDEAPSLRYSTADGQAIDVAVEMTRSDDGLRWQGALPPGSQGAQQDFRYRLIAGDAITEDYRVRVSPAPAIVVRRVEYVFPPYTRRPPLTVEQRGDLVGLEGTRVTLWAEANQPMRSAWIEFDPLAGAAAPAASASQSQAPPRRLPMKVEDRTASVSFPLEWDAQAGDSRHRTYRVRFSTEEGHVNERPILHTIAVQRDLPPEVAILEPRQNRVEVPADGAQEIVVRAIDPDFGISHVAVHAVVGGGNLLLPALLDDPAGQTGQIIVKYNFVPRLHKLQPGDEVVYWARAEDNRAAPGQATREPNVARTQNYRLLITPPKHTNPDASAEEKPEPSAGEKSPAGGADGSQGNEGGEGSEGAGEGEKKKGEGENGEGEAGDQQGGMGEGAAKSDGSEPSSQTGESPGQAGGSPSPGQSPSPQPGESGGQGAPQPGKSGGQPSDNGASSGEPSSRGGTPKAGESPSGEGGQPPLSPDGAQDREVFERLQEFLQDRQPQGQQGQSTGAAGQRDSSAGGSANNAVPANPPSNSNADGRAKADPSPQPGESPQQSGERDQASTPQRPDQRQGEAEGNRAGAGQGGTPQGPAETEKQKPHPENRPDAPAPPPGRGDNGASGAGTRPDQARGSPESQEANRDRQKNSAGGNEKPAGDEGASSPSTSKRQSDSQGGEGGDRSGGGKQGGGQGAKQPGNDSAGSSSAADEGAGAANEPGAGEAANQPGGQQLANRPTGNASNTPGEGSGTRSDPQGGAPQPSPTPQAGRPGESPASPSPPGAPSAPSAADRGTSEGGGQHTFGPQPQGGQPDQNLPSDATPPPTVPESAQVNLDYARRATDLALELLRDQKHDPQSEVLKRLGWTPEDLQRFLARWEAMKQAAAQAGAAGEEGRQSLDETLESLGLRPTNATVRRGGATPDDQRGLRDSGHRTAPPPEYQKQFEAYLKGAGRTPGR